MKRADELHSQIIKKYHQAQTIPNALFIIKDNWSDSIYLLKKFGLKRWYNFWFTKLFIVDEGGEFDFTSSIDRRFPNILKSPHKIEVENTTICNKKCIFCCHNHPAQDIKQQQMSFDNFKKIIDDLPRLNWVNIAGIGSNFLHKDFIRMLEYLSSKNLNVNFVDEFDFFTEEHSRKVIELGVNSLYISFDGATKKTYEKIKVNCNYDKALANIRTLLRLKEEMNSPFPVIHFRFIVNKLNYREMPDYIELINSLKNRGTRARVEFIGLIVFPGIEKYYIGMEEVPEDIVTQTYEKALRYNINLYLSHATMKLSTMSNCVRWTEPFVLVTGEIIQCCAVLMQSNRNFLKKYSFGNVFEKSFGEIWNSKKYKEFRKQIVTPDAKVPQICFDCCAYDTKERASKFGTTE
jgi:MoaA/NifB/PqqE/SkfB family radical SAM enzyme